MDGLDVVHALKRTPKGRLFNKFSPQNSKESQSTSTLNSVGHKPKDCNTEIDCGESDQDEIKSTFEDESFDESSEHESTSDSQMNSSLENYSFTDLLLNASNEEIKTKVTKFVTKKQKEFENKEQELHIKTLIQENLLLEEVRQKCLQIEAEEKEVEDLYAQELENKQRQLRESHHRHAKLLDKKNMEARNEIQHRESLKKIQQEKLMEKMNKEFEDVKMMHQMLMNLISQSGMFEKFPPLLKEAPKLMERILEKCSLLSGKQEFSQENVNTASYLSLEAKKIVSIAHEIIVNLNSSETKLERKPLDQPAKSLASQKTEKANTTQSGRESAQVQEKCSKEFYRLLKVMSDIEDSCKDLIENPEFKDFKRKLTRTIFEPLSTLNDHNPNLLKGFHEKLCRLLQGQVVELPGGGEHVSAKDHPSAILFCLSRLANKIVAYAEKSKSAEHNSLCVLTASIWNMHPSFGDILHSQLVTKCPFIVPHFSHKGDMTDLERYKLLGYDIVGGKLEKEDLYLKRMSNIISYYGGTLTARPLTRAGSFSAAGSASSYRCYGMKRAWEWTSSFLQQEALDGASATVLSSFLAAVGRDMASCYGRQFKKVIAFIRTSYLPRLVKAGQKENVALFNLKDLIEKYAREL